MASKQLLFDTHWGSSHPVGRTAPSARAQSGSAYFMDLIISLLLVIVLRRIGNGGGGGLNIELGVRIPM